MRNARAIRRRTEEVFGIATPYDAAGGSDSPAATIDLPEVTVTAQAPTTPQPAAAHSSTSAPTLYGNWTPALFMPYPRSIGGIIAQVTIEESATDDLVITEHPVEQGAPIADHAFKRPSNVTIRAGWSVSGSYDLSAETGVYGLLLSWQAALLPFDVVTGKRKYTNMLMERLTVVTDQKSEYALMADITCRQVIIVGTQTTTVKTTSESPSNHKDSEKTAPKKENGPQNPEKVGNGGKIADRHDEDATPSTPSPPASQPAGQIAGDVKAVPEANISPTGEAIENKALTQVPVETMREKDMVVDLGGNISKGPATASGGARTGSQAAHQQLVRGVAWQRTVRYQHNRAGRSPSVFRY